jgi:hypothetical protein
LTHQTSTEPEVPSDDIDAGKWAMVGFVVTAFACVLAWPYITPDVESGYPLTERALVQSDGTFLMTMNVTDRDLWIPLDMGQGERVAFGDSPDVIVRRYVVRAPGGAKDLGAVSLAEADASGGGEWLADQVVDGEWMNPATERWYEYSMSNHLLTTKGHTYALRRPAGGIAYFQVQSYYCEPPGSGCMSIRYRLTR